MLIIKKENCISLDVDTMMSIVYSKELKSTLKMMDEMDLLDTDEDIKSFEEKYSAKGFIQEIVVKEEIENELEKYNDYKKKEKEKEVIKLFGHILS